MQPGILGSGFQTPSLPGPPGRQNLAAHQPRASDNPTYDPAPGLAARLCELACSPREGIAVQLTADQRETLRAALSSIGYDPLGGARYLAEIRSALVRCLPGELISLLHAQQSIDTSRAFIRIDNVPWSPLVADPNTDPSKRGRLSKADTLSEHLAVGIAALIGEPYSVGHEGAAIVSDVRPQKDCADEHTSQGYRAPLELHTEHPALKHAADGSNLAPMGLVLVGVHDEAPSPQTRIADAVRALHSLSNDDLQTLMQPIYRIASPARWKSSAPHRNYSTRGPVLFKHNGEPEAVAAFFPDCMAAPTEQGRLALARFGQQLEAQAEAMTLKPGSLVYIDNRLTLHGRDAFPLPSDHPIPQRWLQRTLIAGQGAAFNSFEQRIGRVVTPPSTTPTPRALAPSRATTG